MSNSRRGSAEGGSSLRSALRVVLNALSRGSSVYNRKCISCKLVSQEVYLALDQYDNNEKDISALRESAISYLQEIGPKLERWSTLTLVTCLVHEAEIKKCLNGLWEASSRLKSSLEEKGVTFPGLFPQYDASSDNVEVAEALTEAVTNTFHREEILELSGQDLLLFQNLLQFHLDMVDPSDLPAGKYHEFQEHGTRVLRKLSRGRAGQPESKTLSNDEIDFAQEELVSTHGSTSLYVAKSRSRPNRRFALKEMSALPSDLTDKIWARFSREIAFWQQLDHPNILPFYGVLPHPGPDPSNVLVTPWMEHGNADIYVKQNPAASRLAIIAQMARGLNYLHACSPSILHGNLKASNILINTKGDACLCDFGLTQHHRPRMSLKPKKNQDGLGSVPWMSPEYYLSEMPTAQSDTWAFAMTGLELITGRAPFLPLDASQIADAIIVKRERPTRPQDATSVNYGLGDRLWALFTRCWSEDPSARPDIRAIVAVVDKLAGNWEARATSPVASNEGRYTEAPLSPRKEREVYYPAVKEKQTSKCLVVPRNLVGGILGPRWIGVKKTMSDLDVSLHVNNDVPDKSTFEISGKEENVDKLMTIIVQKMDDLTPEDVSLSKEMMTSITQSNSITLATLRKLVNVRVDATIQSITIRGPKSHRETAKLFLQETQQQKQDAKAAETSALPPRKSHQRTKSTPAAPPLSLTLGISIPTQFHARLIGRGGARCREIQQESGAVVCFPGSSTYRAAAAPCNEDELENVHASTIIKVSGTRGACETALGILKQRMEELKPRARPRSMAFL